LLLETNTLFFKFWLAKTTELFATGNNKSDLEKAIYLEAKPREDFI